MPNAQGHTSIGLYAYITKVDFEYKNRKIKAGDYVYIGVDGNQSRNNNRHYQHTTKSHKYKQVINTWLQDNKGK